MRTAEFQEYGGPEVLRIVEAKVPEPGPGQVSVDVAYAGVNFADLLARSGATAYRACPSCRAWRSRAGSGPSVRTSRDCGWARRSRR